MPSLNDVRLWHGAIFVKRGPFEGGVLRFRFQLPAECAGWPRAAAEAAAPLIYSSPRLPRQLPDAGRFSHHHFRQPGLPSIRRPQGPCPPPRQRLRAMTLPDHAWVKLTLRGPVHRPASWTSLRRTRRPRPARPPRCGTCGKPFTTARGGPAPKCATGRRRSCPWRPSPSIASLPPSRTPHRLNENESAFMERASGCALLSRKKVYDNEEGSTLRFSRPTAQHDMVRKLVFGGVIVRAAAARRALQRPGRAAHPLAAGTPSTRPLGASWTRYRGGNCPGRGQRRALSPTGRRAGLGRRPHPRPRPYRRPPGHAPP